MEWRIIIIMQRKKILKIMEFARRWRWRRRRRKEANKTVARYYHHPNFRRAAILVCNYIGHNNNILQLHPTTFLELPVIRSFIVGQKWFLIDIWEQQKKSAIDVCSKALWILMCLNWWSGPNSDWPRDVQAQRAWIVLRRSRASDAKRASLKSQSHNTKERS